MTVDLHGLTLSHSLKIVEEAVNTWWANARDGTFPLSSCSPLSSFTMTELTSLTLDSCLSSTFTNYYWYRTTFAQPNSDSITSSNETSRQERLEMEI